MEKLLHRVRVSLEWREKSEERDEILFLFHYFDRSINNNLRVRVEKRERERDFYIASRSYISAGVDLRGWDRRLKRVGVGEEQQVGWAAGSRATVRSLRYIHAP